MINSIQLYRVGSDLHLVSDEKTSDGGNSSLSVRGSHITPYTWFDVSIFPQLITDIKQVTSLELKTIKTLKDSWTDVITPSVY